MAKQDMFYKSTSDSDLGKWFKENYIKWAKENGIDVSNTEIQNYLKNIKDVDLGALLKENFVTDDVFSNDLGIVEPLNTLHYADALEELSNISKYEKAPELKDFLGEFKDLDINYDDYLKEAQSNIDAENADILKMYDTNLSRQTELYNRELNNINNSYNTYARQVLSNDYNKNASILDTYKSDMSRARQNALEAGANAGLRIAGNINTLLSAQNKQASTSLETSNQLAQAMLNQRNAAAGVRSDYNSMLDADTNNRAALRRGSYERATSAASNRYNSMFGDYQNRYNLRKQQYTDATQMANERNANYSGDAFYNSYMKQRKVNDF